MAESKHSPFFEAALRSADAATEARRAVEKAKGADWEKEFAPMAQVRKRLERASSNEERRAIRKEIQGMPNAETKMRQLTRHYKGGKP